jgi:hypothetical protein
MQTTTAVGDESFLVICGIKGTIPAFVLWKTTENLRIAHILLEVKCNEERWVQNLLYDNFNGSFGNLRGMR